MKTYNNTTVKGNCSRAFSKKNNDNKFYIFYMPAAPVPILREIC